MKRQWWNIWKIIWRVPFQSLFNIGWFKSLLSTIISCFANGLFKNLLHWFSLKKLEYGSRFSRIFVIFAQLKLINLKIFNFWVRDENSIDVLKIFIEILNSMKSIKSEDSFSYQYLRHFYLLSTALQALQNALYNKISIEKPLMQIYNYLGQ